MFSGARVSDFTEIHQMLGDDPVLEQRIDAWIEAAPSGEKTSWSTTVWG